MNNIKFLHLVSRTRALCGGYVKHPGFLQQLVKRTMQSSVSISQIMKEKEVFHDALPGIVDNLQANSKMSQLPEVGSWVRKDQWVQWGTSTWLNPLVEADNDKVFFLMIYQTIGEPLSWILVTIGNLVNFKQSPYPSQLQQRYFLQVLEHNLSGGKHSRGLITMLSYEMLENPDKITDEKLKLSRVLGWCVEMLQAYFIVIDDIMDGSTTRRGMPCWYRMPNVGLGAINDSLLIHCAIMETLETYFGKTEHYVDVIRLFNEALLFTSMGQHLDYTTAQQLKDYSLFTLDRYESIVKYKTSCYTFRLPVLLGLTLVNDVNESLNGHVHDICMKLGRLFQMQDDYIDCYGDESVTGKAGTDIQEGKCSWLAVTTLQRCNEAQRALFTQYYGSKDPEHVDIIKRLYDDLRLPEVYRQEETDVYDDIMQRVRALPSETAPTFFLKLVERIYKRKN